ncbi:TRAF interacting protein no poles [Xylocopa sonorina]|uniref:TRAF interacting protein no poles n=1 Tax=Xylocopa sonorina TaxID=1818115 RepID=UPI00403AD6EC
MNIVCVICSDLLVPSDDVFHTPCGHIFHFACLTQWLERSKTCPQCREKTTSSKIHRIYFNFANSDNIIEDTCSLQDKVDKLNFQLVLKEKDVKHYAQKVETLETQNKMLKVEVRKVESELNEKQSGIYALKEQINYFREQNLEVENKKKEIEQLRKRLENYKNIQTLLEASVEDVDELVLRTCDANTLVTYITVMKREMTTTLNKRRELRTKLRSLQQELTKVSMERNFLSEEETKRKKLEEDLMACESEKMLLQNKIQALEKDIYLTKKSNNANLKTVNASNSKSCNCLEERRIEYADKNIKNEKPNMCQRKDQSINTNNEINSPYLPVKSIGVLALNQHAGQKRGTVKLPSSILTKKPRIEQTYINNERVQINAYNGLGGHSKLELFPSSSGIKVKKI